MYIEKCLTTHHLFCSEVIDFRFYNKKYINIDVTGIKLPPFQKTEYITNNQQKIHKKCIFFSSQKLNSNFNKKKA